MRTKCSKTGLNLGLKKLLFILILSLPLSADWSGGGGWSDAFGKGWSAIQSWVYKYSNTYSIRFRRATPVYLNLGNVLHTGKNGTGTWAYWAKLDDLSDYQVLQDEQGNPNNLGKGVANFTDNSTGVMRFQLRSGPNGDAIMIQTDAQAQTGVWALWVFTLDGSATAAGQHIYLNCSLASTNIVQDGLVGDPTSPDFNPIGIDAKLLGALEGSMDEVVRWDVALSATEVGELCATGNHPSDLTQTSKYSHVLGWWRMGDCPGDITTIIKNCKNPGVYDGVAIGLTSASFQTDIP